LKKKLFIIFFLIAVLAYGQENEQSLSVIPGNDIGSRSDIPAFKLSLGGIIGIGSYKGMGQAKEGWAFFDGEKTYSSHAILLNLVSPTINGRLLFPIENKLQLGLGIDFTFLFFGLPLSYSDEPDIVGGTLAAYAIVGYRNYYLHIGYDFGLGGLYLAPSYAVNKRIMIGLPMSFGNNHRFGLYRLVLPPETYWMYYEENYFQIGLSIQYVFGGRQELIENNQHDKEAWKNKWVYLGGGLGGGSFITDSTTPVYAGVFLADFALLPFFSIELCLPFGFYYEPFPDFHSEPLFDKISVIAMLAKLGARISQIEISVDIGYSVGAGFTVGGTFGLNVGQGILFAKFISIPNLDSFETARRFSAQSVMMGFLGYKIGIGDKR
jgi:hypothetical protein